MTDESFANELNLFCRIIVQATKANIQICSFICNSHVHFVRRKFKFLSEIRATEQCPSL